MRLKPGGGTLEINHLGSTVFPMTYTIAPGGRVTLFVNSGDGFGTLVGQLVNKGRSMAFSMLLLVSGGTGYDVAGMLQGE
jgi:hypothetical protein